MEQTEREFYSASPALEVLSDIKAFWELPEDVRIETIARFVESRLLMLDT